MGHGLLRHIALAGLVLAATGCYKPAVDACLYRCAGTSCPGGLTCNDDSWCVESMPDRCDDIDASVSVDVAPDSACGWDPSNFDVCFEGLDGISTTWNVASSDILMIDTTTGTFSGAPVSRPPTGSFVQLKDQKGLGVDLAFVIGVRNLDIAGTVIVIGDKPLLIFAANTAKVTGEIRFDDSSAGNISCNGRNGGDGDMSNGGGGAGGGSFTVVGASGGVGGTAGGTAVPPAGAAGNLVTGATQALTPMIGGCSGGRGGKSNDTITMTMDPGGDGGRGGGAIQISARASIELTSGTLRVNGGGGKGTGNHGGGGGGGSGGAILLEAPTITFAGSRLCANGGGGAASFPNGNGSVNVCTSVPAPGGGNAAAPNDSGGSGGVVGQPAVFGKPGAQQAPWAHGGGGGGGGLGRIRVLGTVNATNTVSSPMYTP
jgi:hypothetical protein